MAYKTQEEIDAIAYQNALRKSDEIEDPLLALKSLKRALELAASRSFQEKFNIIERIIARSKQAGTQEYVLEALEANRGSYNITTEIALFFEEIGDNNKAIEIIERYRLEHPEEIPPRKKNMGYNLSRLYSKENNQEKRLENMQETVKYGYDDINMLRYARLQANMGDFEAAEETYRTILSNTKNEKIRQSVQKDMEYNEKLKAQITKVEQNPEDPKEAYKLALQYMERYAFDKAEEYAKKSLDVKYNLGARDLLIQVFLKEGKEEEAEELIVQRMKLNGPDFFYTPKLAGIYIRQGRTEEATYLMQQMEEKKSKGQNKDKKTTIEDILKLGYFGREAGTPEDVINFIKTQVQGIEEYEILRGEDNQSKIKTKSGKKINPPNPGEERIYADGLSAEKRSGFLKKLAEDNNNEKVETYLGSEDFAGYVMFAYPDRRMVVLEKFFDRRADGTYRSSYGDATYVFSMDASIGISGDETSLAKLSKAEIKEYMNSDNNGVIKKITHPSKKTEIWYKKLECAVNGVEYKEPEKRKYTRRSNIEEAPVVEETPESEEERQKIAERIKQMEVQIAENRQKQQLLEQERIKLEQEMKALGIDVESIDENEDIGGAIK